MDINRKRVRKFLIAVGAFAIAVFMVLSVALAFYTFLGAIAVVALSQLGLIANFSWGAAFWIGILLMLVRTDLYIDMDE